MGARKLRELTADDVDRWLAAKARTHSTRTLRLLLSILRRAITRAMKRDKVKRNVALLCEAPTGLEGRPSKALSLAQANALLVAARLSRLFAYFVVSLLIGARTEELRPLEWAHVDLVGRPDADPPVPPSIEVRRSVRVDGDTKTIKSRHTLALAAMCVEALHVQRAQQQRDRAAAGNRWHNTGLVFTSKTGLALDAANVRRALRRVLQLAGLDPDEWTPRELRHSFVSILSDNGVRLEIISDLVGHAGTTVTSTVYRHPLRPILLRGGGHFLGHSRSGACHPLIRDRLPLAPAAEPAKDTEPWQRSRAGYSSPAEVNAAVAVCETAVITSLTNPLNPQLTARKRVLARYRMRFSAGAGHPNDSRSRTVRYRPGWMTFSASTASRVVALWSLSAGEGWTTNPRGRERQQGRRPELWL